MGRLGDLLATKPFLAMFLQQLNRWSTKKDGMGGCFSKKIIFGSKESGDKVGQDLCSLLNLESLGC